MYNDEIEFTLNLFGAIRNLVIKCCSDVVSLADL